jgi:O-6-methylguanine DNA methyltransferase
MEITVVETPRGYIGLVGGPGGLRAVTHFRPSPADCLAEAEAEVGCRPLETDRFRAWEDTLRRYAAGEPVEFDLDGSLDPDVGTPFERLVWAQLRKIPWGQVVSYGRLAASLGRPEAVRAVGRAVGNNPWAVVVPCHRVVGADGRLVGYGGGIDLKATLLELEGHRVDRQRLRLRCCRPGRRHE